MKKEKYRKAVFIEDLSEEQFDKEMEKGFEDIENGKTISLEEAERIIKVTLKWIIKMGRLSINANPFFYFYNSYYLTKL